VDISGTTPEPTPESEDNSAANWQSALENHEGFFDQSELIWYEAKSPEYGPGEPTPAQTEAARRFVSQWLNVDNHGFIIPGNEWGKSLLHWLNILTARPAPGEDAEPELHFKLAEES
jgi:hypothetical protein